VVVDMTHLEFMNQDLTLYSYEPRASRGNQEEEEADRRRRLARIKAHPQIGNPLRPAQYGRIQ